MSLTGSDSSNTSQQQQQLATAASTTGAQKGTYTNAPINSGQLTGALGSAQDLFQNGTPTTQAGLDAINVGAQGAGDLYTGAQPTEASTINGSYLNAGNPNFQGMVSQMAQGIRPTIDSGFEANGRGGSGANANAYDSAVANAAGGLAYQNYGAERGIQNSDLQNLPSYTAGMFQPGQAQMTAGYTPINQFINQLKSISPGSTGSFDTTTAGTSTGTQAGSGTSSGDTSKIGFAASSTPGKSK